MMVIVMVVIMMAVVSVTLTSCSYCTTPSVATAGSWRLEPCAPPELMR